MKITLDCKKETCLLLPIFSEIKSGNGKLTSDFSYLSTLFWYEAIYLAVQTQDISLKSTSIEIKKNLPKE